MKRNSVLSFIVAKCFKRPAGLQSFSLVEILIVVVLLGVAAGLAIPNFASSYDQFLLNETAKDMSFLMRYAQNRAVIKSKKELLVLDLENHTYWLEESKDTGSDESSNDSFARIEGRFGRNFNIPAEIAFEAENTKTYFYPDGKIDKVRIYISNKRKNYFTVSTREQAGYVQVFDFKVE